MKRYVRKRVGGKVKRNCMEKGRMQDRWGKETEKGKRRNKNEKRYGGNLDKRKMTEC